MGYFFKKNNHHLFALLLVDRGIVDRPEGLSQLLWVVLDKGHAVARYPRAVLSEIVAGPVATEGQVDDHGVLSKVVGCALGVASQIEVGVGKTPLFWSGHTGCDVAGHRPTREEPSCYKLLSPLQSVDTASLRVEGRSVAARSSCVCVYMCDVLL